MGGTGYRQSNPGSGNHVCKGTEAGRSVMCVGSIGGQHGWRRVREREGGEDMATGPPSGFRQGTGEITEMDRWDKRESGLVR